MLSGLTGSMVVFREEIEALIHPEWMQADVGSKRVSLQIVLDTVKRTYPQDKLLSVRMPREPQQTYLLKMNDAHGLFVYADPYSGELLGGHRQDETFIGWLALVHTELLVPLVENALTAPAGTRIYNNLYSLHIGEAGGLTTRILQLLVSFSPLILFATGYIMWRNRSKVKVRK